MAAPAAAAAGAILSNPSTRKGIAAAAAGAAALLLLVLLIPLALLQGESTPGKAPAGSGIPRVYVGMYQEAQRVFHVNWLLIASIHKQETDFGRSTLSGVRSGVNSYGCCAGPMQFNLSDTWAGYQLAFRKGRRPAGDYPLHKATLPSCAGHRSERQSGCVYDSFDAIMAAGQKLRGQGAGMSLDAPGARQALCGYNCDPAYIDAVLGRAKEWERAGGGALQAPIGRLELGGGGATPANVRIGPGANRPGVSIKPITLAYVSAMATLIGRPIVISTGTNHDRLSQSGLVSDHWDGHAADLGMAANGSSDSGPLGDRIMTACLVLAGQPVSVATRNAHAGGLYTLTPAHLRVQCIWKTMEGGNHFNHVHVGVQPR